MSLPDHDATFIEIAALAEEARDRIEVKAPATEAPQPDRIAVAAPIYLGKAHEVVPDRYIVHFTITHCKNCGSQSSDNKFYALSFIRSRVTGSRVKHLVPCDTPLFNLPVERIPTGKRALPFCCECDIIDLSHLPPPPSASQLYDLDEPRQRGAKPKTAKEAKPAKPAPKAATLDDLA